MDLEEIRCQLRRGYSDQCRNEASWLFRFKLLSCGHIPSHDQERGLVHRYCDAHLARKLRDVSRLGMCGECETEVDPSEFLVSIERL